MRILSLFFILVTFNLAQAKIHNPSDFNAINGIGKSNSYEAEFNLNGYLVLKDGKPHCYVGDLSKPSSYAVDRCNSGLSELALLTEDAPEERYASLTIAAAACAVGAGVGVIMRSHKALSKQSKESLKDGFNGARNIGAGLISYPLTFVATGGFQIFPAFAFVGSLGSVLLPAVVCAEIGENITDYVILKVQNN